MRQVPAGFAMVRAQGASDAEVALADLACIPPVLLDGLHSHQHVCERMGPAKSSGPGQSHSDLFTAASAPGCCCERLFEVTYYMESLFPSGLPSSARNSGCNVLKRGGGGVGAGNVKGLHQSSPVGKDRALARVQGLL